MVHTVSTEDIKLNQKQNRLQVAEETNSERLGVHRFLEEGVLSSQSNKMSVSGGREGVEGGVCRVSEGQEGA